MVLYEEGLHTSHGSKKYIEKNASRSRCSSGRAKKEQEYHSLKFRSKKLTQVQQGGAEGK